MKTYKLVLLRHGESLWNKENKFTGWVDVDLSEKGQAEALEAGRLLKKEGFEFDKAYTSVLKRAIGTLWRALEQLDQMWIPVEKSWRLNERHYGNLQGRDKKQTAKEVGEDQVFKWRRSYDIPPPPLAEDSQWNPKKDRRYALVAPEELPQCEALKNTLERVLPYWKEVIAPEVKKGERLLIAAHGNSLRALVKHLDDISDEEISSLNIPTGVPLVYELDENLRPIKSYYLGDAEAAEAKAKAVANQASQ